MFFFFGFFGDRNFIVTIEVSKARYHLTIRFMIREFLQLHVHAKEKVKSIAPPMYLLTIIIESVFRSF